MSKTGTKVRVYGDAVLRKTAEPVTAFDDDLRDLIEDMIDRSGNEAADWLMNRVVDPQRGPLLVTDDMKAAAEKAKADIIAGTIKVHDYTADNTCPVQ